MSTVTTHSTTINGMSLCIFDTLRFTAFFMTFYSFSGTVNFILLFFGYLRTNL